MLTTLQLSTGQLLNDPTDEELREALASLDLYRDGEGFAILARTQATYIQANGDAHLRFDLAFQEGTEALHYRNERTDFTLEEAVRAFAAYRDETIRWVEFGEWFQVPP